MLQSILANLAGFLALQSITTIIYLLINYQLLKRMLVPPISKGLYLVTIVPILVLVALFYSYNLDKADKLIGLGLITYSDVYLAICAFLHAIIFPFIRKFLGKTKNILREIGTVIAANGIACIVAMFAIVISFLGLGAIRSFLR